MLFSAVANEHTMVIEAGNDALLSLATWVAVAGVDNMSADILFVWFDHRRPRQSRIHCLTVGKKALVSGVGIVRSPTLV